MDSHAHLDMPELATDLPQVLARAKRNDVTHIVTIGADISSSQKAVEISREYPDIFAAVGFHPHDAKKVSESDYITLKKLMRLKIFLSSRYVRQQPETPLIYSESSNRYL